MDPVAEILVLVDCSNDVRMKIAWERRRELDAVDAGCGNGSQQPGKHRRAFHVLKPEFHLRAITVHVLPNQMNLAITVVAELLHLCDDLGGGPALLAAS